jgi:putative transposase
VVGWIIAPAELAVLAQRFHQRDLRKAADRGVAVDLICGSRLLHDIQTGGVAARRSVDSKMHSQPYTSDDNPFSEAQSKTQKYRPDFPKCFESIEAVRVFCQTFFSRYNSGHRHSGIELITPAAAQDGWADTM